MKKGIRKTIAIIAILTMTFQMGMPMIPGLQTTVLATDITNSVEKKQGDMQPTADKVGQAELSESVDATPTEEISRNYEIKEEETWDISANGDGSVIAKWTLENRTLTISGTGEMKNWPNDSKEDWRNTQYASLIERVIIEEGITRIETFTLERCTNLESITIPKSVVNIDSFALDGYDNLKSINVDINNRNYTSEDGVLYDKNKTRLMIYPSAKSDIKEYHIPQSVTWIETYAFSECRNIESIIVPDSVTRIDSYAFEGCSRLININIPKGLTRIPNGVFLGCSSLKRIEIPEGVTSIGANAFQDCSSLISIEIPQSVTSIESYAFNGCSSLTSIEIPKGLKSIEDVTFCGCSSLENIIIPEGVTSIGSSAFSECSSLKSIDIPENVKNIGNGALPKTAVIYVKADSEGHRYAEEAKQGYILNGETKNIETNYEIKEEETWDISAKGDGSVIAKWTLSDKTLTIDGTGEVKDWEDGSTEDWHNLQYIHVIQKVVIEDGITSIGSHMFYTYDNSFYGCSSLESIDIPRSITNIESNAFSRCTSLTSINVDVNNTNYMDEDGILFNKDKTKIIIYPQGKKDIKEYIIPKEVTSIVGGAFSGCSSLESITIPEGVTSIGSFSGCSSLKSIEIPEGVTSIGSFSRCSSLESINIPEGVTSIESFGFYNCTSLTSIDIPDKVTNIGEATFAGCSSLNSINIPEGVTTIKNMAFSGCSSLESINIPEEVTSIGYSAFEGCSSLKSIEIPEGVTSIGNSAFLGCSSLENITIPEGVTSLGKETIPKSTIIYVKMNSEGHRYAEEGMQGYIIDDILPNVELKYSTTELTKENVTVMITSNEEIQSVLGWTLSSDKKTLTKEYSTNTKEIITIKDLVGNEKQVNIEINNIDKTVPKVNVGYSTKNPTKGNVKVTITSNEEVQSVPGWILSSDKNTLTKEYSTNTKETITIKDLAGNETQAIIEINNIDRTGPIVNVEYSTKNPTRENVKVTITSNEKIQSVTGWTLSSDKKTLTKEYSGNTKETITIKDLAGNETQATIEINNIDRTGPSVNVGYSTKNPTRENVTVTITSNKEVQSVTGWTLSSDKKTLTKEYSGNTKETIAIKDLAGNETQATIEINNIDRTGPIVNVEYSTKNPTKENVRVTITSNEEVQTITGWILSSDKKTLTKEYSSNTKETITIKDLVGNETQVDIEITNIDKTLPEIMIGDINQDGKIDVTDFLMLKRNLVAGNRSDWKLTGDSLLSADMNENGTVDITDMLMLKRVIVENI